MYGGTTSLKSVITKSLIIVAPFKKQIVRVRGNNKPHIKSLIRKKIMTRSRLKSKATKKWKRGGSKSI